MPSTEHVQHPTLGADDAALLAAIERGLTQAAAGEFAAIHTPEVIASDRARRPGRPAGSVAAIKKQPVTLRIAPDVLQKWRATGKGWQTRMAEVLARAV